MSLPTNLGLSARGVDRDAGNKSLVGTTAADNLNRLLEAFRYQKLNTVNNHVYILLSLSTPIASVEATERYPQLKT